MSITYRVVIKDPYGRNPKGLQPISLQASRALNTVGASQLILPNIFRPEYWQRDMQVEIWRVVPTGHTYLLGDTIWLARRFVWHYSEKQWEVNLVDSNTVLERRLVAYTAETTYAEKSEEWGNEGPADDLMREFVRENLGSAALDTNRNLSTYLDIENDRSLAPITQKEGSFRELLSVLSDLSNDAANQGEVLYYNINPLPNGRFLFTVNSTALGQLRTQLNTVVTFGPHYKNMTDIVLEWDYREEKTYVYAGGDGEGAERLIVEIEDVNRSRRSPFGRIEMFYDGRDIDDENLLLAEARAALDKARPKLRLTGKVVDTPNIQFGRDYFYGDQVRAVVDGFTFDCLIDAFSISYAEGKESDLDVRLKGEVAI